MNRIDDEPTMSEMDGVRYLHFGSEWIQGAMRVRKPAELVLAYTRQMMSWLLFLEPSARDQVGILGLGAGALLRYVLAHTPAGAETVEWNPQVTAICRSYFRLPESKRSVITHVDAGEWVYEVRNTDRFMALMVDLYDAQAQGPVRDSVAFYAGCRRTLAEAGVMVVNLFGNHESFPRNMDNIREAFDGRVLELPEIDAGNRVVLAFKGPLLDVSVAAFMERAGVVESVYGLPATKWARALLRQKSAGAALLV